jgi:hypothetical protein
MEVGTDAPWWMKVISWVAPKLKAAERLKKYATELIFKDEPKFVRLRIAEVIAENELQARQLSNAQAIKDEPVIDDNLDQRQIIPPYMKDAGAMLLLAMDCAGVPPDR